LLLIKYFMDNKISACLVLHNEEELIRACLESIKNVVDEIIIVHDGKCEDNTLKICSEYTNNIYVREKIGSAPPHRPLSYNKASYDWVLHIDADERLSKELQINLKNLLRQKKYAAFEFLWPMPGSDIDNKKIKSFKLCFYNKNKISFLGIPHFIPIVKGRIKKTDFLLEHKPSYNKINFNIFKNKWLKVSKFQASFYFKDFKDINKYNYPSKDWPFRYKIKKNFSLLLIPIDFFRTLMSELLRIKIYGNFYDYKICLYKALNKAALNFYIFIFKFKKKISQK
jgi:glycosyltransferase involved in cell wall biosynthesis